MTEIKAIETEYNGYRFRSRLEARWAVFFDKCCIQYEYEPEGYLLNDGTKYLPDFYLPEFDIFVEIKPFDENIVSYSGDNNKWEKKCEEFIQSTGRTIMLCYGDPASRIRKRLFTWFEKDSGGGSENVECEFIQDPITGMVLICTEDTGYRWVRPREENWITYNERFGTVHQLLMSRRWHNRLWEKAVEEMDSTTITHDNCILFSAKEAARQARFEHGEKPLSVHQLWVTNND